MATSVSIHDQKSFISRRSGIVIIHLKDAIPEKMKSYVAGIALVVALSSVIYSQEIIPGCPGCSEKGTCYFANQEWLQGCWTKKCIVYPGGLGWRTSIVKTQCPDTYGRCIDHGQKNSNGCYCQVNNLKWSFLCSGK